MTVRLKNNYICSFSNSYLSESVPYMINDAFKALMSEIQDYHHKCDEIIEEITNTKDFVKSVLEIVLENLM